jgi:hypothetical protein
MVISDRGTLSVCGELLRVLVLNQSEAASYDAAARQGLIAQLLARGMVLILLAGSAMQIAYDHPRWPDITADQIEAALRYDQSQAAAELRRIGAVPADFRPLTRTEAEALVGRSPQ